MRAMQNALITISLFATAGCASAPAPDSGRLDGLVDQQLAEVQRQIADAGLYDGALEPYATGTTTLVNPEHLADETLLSFIDPAFNGTIEELVEAVADRTGYRAVADGEKPGAPIVIVLVQHDLTVIGALREGFLQAKHSARLIIDQRARTMTIVYARPEASPVPSLEDREI